MSAILENTAVTTFVFSGDDWREARKTYRIDLLISRDDEGVYSAVALNLPGAGSCGETADEAVENAKEAIRGVLESHSDANEAIPWTETTAQKSLSGLSEGELSSMPKVPRITGEEAVRAFRKVGFYQDRMTGSHCILKKAGHPYHLSVPLHKGKTLGKGLLKSLIEAAGLSVEQFIELL